MRRRPDAARPARAASELDRAAELTRAGQRDAAEAAYRHVLSRAPDSFRANHALALLRLERGDAEQALAFAERAVALAPSNPGALLNLGAALRSLGQLDRSIAATLRARALAPQIAETHYNLGNTLDERAGEQPRPSAEVEHAYRCALALRPTYLKALYQLAQTLIRSHELAEALGWLDRACALEPHNAALHAARAVVLRQVDRLEAAEASYRRAVVLDPSAAAALFNYGNLRLARADPAGAIAWYDRALDFNPSDAEYHWNRSLALLSAGRFEEGWIEYEWRWRWHGFSTPRRDFEQPLWDGSPLGGRTILLHAEQGLGDTIQFIRYAKPIRAAGGRVVVECQPELARLLAGAPGIDVLVAAGAPLPAFDTHAPLLSLPRLMRTEVASIPAATPYLQSPGGFRLPRPRRFNIGIQWAGNPKHAKDKQRSITPDRFAFLQSLPGVQVYSLQVGWPGDELATQRSTAAIIDLAPQLKDLGDTAAAIMSLDLVVSVDTAVAHLAGALGKPVWTLLAYAADWRWLLGREDTPWYPSMRLFRQPSPGDWDAVMQTVAAHLKARVFRERDHVS